MATRGKKGGSERSPVGGILLAATRQAENGKPVVVPIPDADLVEEAMEILVATDVDQLVVVMGEQAGTIAFVIGPMPITVKRQRDWSRGMRGGIVSGLKTLDPETAGVLITTVELAGVAPRAVNRLIRAFKRGTAKWVVAHDGTRPRLPVIVDLSEKAALAGLKDEAHLLDLVAEKGKAVELVDISQATPDPKA